MSNPIKVTVDEPVTREVSWEDVRGYLRAHWGADAAGALLEKLHAPIGCNLDEMVRAIAEREDRHPRDRWRCGPPLRQLHRCRLAKWPSSKGCFLDE